MMKAIGGVILACGMLAATPVLAQGACTRSALLAAADSYVAAQKAGSTAGLALAPSVKYLEHINESTLATGMLSTPQKIDFHRTLADTQTCETFTEVMITDPAHPYVLGTRLKLADGKIAEIETLVTDKDDWLFSAANTYKYASAETWGVVPAASRSDRATLIAAANAYLDLFNDPTSQVPWGTPCRRLEGGIYTGKGKPDDSCNVGVPKGVSIVDRRYIVDAELNSVVGLVVFGKNALPDSHMFRLENGKITNIHTITVCKTFNCGFPPARELQGQQ